MNKSQPIIIDQEIAGSYNSKIVTAILPKNFPLLPGLPGLEPKCTMDLYINEEDFVGDIDCNDSPLPGWFKKHICDTDVHIRVKGSTKKEWLSMSFADPTNLRIGNPSSGIIGCRHAWKLILSASCSAEEDFLIEIDGLETENVSYGLKENGDIINVYDRSLLNRSNYISYEHLPHLRKKTVQRS
ncbi:MAG: hypothetical protein K2W82_00845 [Candidatus Obscuribacterales bacterium]|nr:hypothetical protein [Candidatus Obscuribacterales bacterium]